MLEKIVIGKETCFQDTAEIEYANEKLKKLQSKELDEYSLSMPFLIKMVEYFFS